MPILFDVYVLAPDRSAEFATQFLERFLPKRRALFSDADLQDLLGVAEPVTINRALRHLESNVDAAATFYWSNPESKSPHFAILSFTEDGALVLGLSPCGESDPRSAVAALQRLMDYAGSPHGYIGVEEAPPGTRDEYFERLDGWAPEV